MENRRHPGSNPASSYNQQNRYYKRQDDTNRTDNNNSNNRNYGDRRFQPRNDRFQSRDGGGVGRYQPRHSGSGGGHGGSSTGERVDRFRGGSRDDRYPPREDRFRGGDRRGGGGSGDRFQSRERSNDRDHHGGGGRFQPRGKGFFPRGGSTGSRQEAPWKTQVKPKVYDEMQVTDGKHRGKFLKSTASPKVRPTARRIREVMFRLIFRRVRAGRFLDLCAGSGTVGIEAISRGALIATFVERSARMCSFVKKNLEACGIKEGHGEVCEMEVVPFLKKMAKRRRYWDVVYYDPPYDTNYDEVLDFLKRGVAIKPDGLLVIEHHAEMFFPERIGVLKRWRVITQGDTALSFYERKS